MSTLGGVTVSALRLTPSVLFSTGVLVIFFFVNYFVCLDLIFFDQNNRTLAQIIIIIIIYIIQNKIKTRRHKKKN